MEERFGWRIAVTNSFDAVWYSPAWWARAFRCILWPLSLVFRGVVALRNFGYDLGLLRRIESPVPVLSVGNISVGGTGKTPVAALFARLLRERGYAPAIVMRGYGDDEPTVHEILSPGVPVIVDADRVKGIATAVHQGANAVVLDDAFQHRRAERDVDIVLVSAERWNQSSLLPAGPLREPRRALRRASLVIVTHRVAPFEAVKRVIHEIQQVAPHLPVASVALSLDHLISVADTRSVPLESLRNTRLLAFAGIGDPEAFFAQLRAMGALVDTKTFPDHHPFSDEEVVQLQRVGTDHKYVVGTLKDIVKVRGRWAPKEPLLWYVSQAVEFTSGKPLVDATVNHIFPYR